MWRSVYDRVQGKAPPGARRSRGWRKRRLAHLRRYPRCAVCGGKKKLEVHHIIPFHLAPMLELDPENLMTLCEAGKYGIVCHQLVGHLGNYRRINPAVRSDVAFWAAKLR